MDRQTARKLAQRAGMGRLAALVLNEGLANVTFNPAQGQYALTPLRDDRLEMLTLPGRHPFMAEDKDRTDGLIVPSAMYESDIVLGSYIYQRKETAREHWKTIDGDVQPEAFVQILRVWNDWDETLTGQFAVRLRSSYDQLTAAYLRQRPCPTLDSDWITWEQSIVEGTMHPLHSCRMVMDSKLQSENVEDYSRPDIAFVVVDRASLAIYGDLEAELQPLLKAAGIDASSVKASEFIVPVNEFQIKSLLAEPGADEHIHQVLPQRIAGLAQSSTRTITVPGVPGIAVKLSISMIIGDTDRLVKRSAVSAGYHVSTSNMFDRERVEGLRESNLEIIPEVAGAVGFRDRIGVIIRRENFYDHHAAGLEDDVACFLVGALQEPAVMGEPECVAESIFNLTTRQARQDFFRQYIRFYLQTFLPPLLINGLLFYAHGQNSILKVSKSTKKLLGFALRDLGDTGINVETFESSTGMPVSEDVKSGEKSTHDVQRLLDNAGRILFATVLLRFGLRLRLDQHDPALTLESSTEPIVDGKTIIVQELDAILRKYEDRADAGKGPNLAKLARQNWLERPKWPIQAFISQRMRADWSHRHRSHDQSRVNMSNVLYTQDCCRQIDRTTLVEEVAVA